MKPAHFIVAISFCALLGGSAHAYAPEDLLRKVIVATPELKAPGSYQFLNPFSKVGVGWERPDFDKKENEVSLSLSPKGLGEAVEYKHLSGALRRDIDVSRKLYRSQSLQTAYSALISAALAKEQQATIGELRGLLGMSQKLSGLEARLDRTELKNVLKATSDLQKSMNEMIDTEAQLSGIKKFLESRGLPLTDLDLSDLMDPEDISAQLARAPVNENEVALTSQKILSEVDVAKHAALHATAERSKLLDDVKFSVKQDQKKERTYKVEVSFNLPFLAAQDMDDYRDSIKVADSSVKAQQAILEESLRSAGLAEVLQRKISLYRAMGSGPKWEKSGLLRQDPALALDLQRSSVALRLARATMLSEIRTIYVSLLLETETLARDPETNHLSRSKRKI